MADSVSVRLKNARVEKAPLNIRMQWNAGTACVSECALKMLACRDLRVGPSKLPTDWTDWDLGGCKASFAVADFKLTQISKWIFGRPRFYHSFQFWGMCLVNISVGIQERKSNLNIKLLGGISCRRPGRRPGPKTFTPSLGAQENKVFLRARTRPKSADVHDPRGSQKNLYAGKLRAGFRFL